MSQPSCLWKFRSEYLILVLVLVEISELVGGLEANMIRTLLGCDISRVERLSHCQANVLVILVLNLSGQTIRVRQSVASAKLSIIGEFGLDATTKLQRQALDASETLAIAIDGLRCDLHLAEPVVLLVAAGHNGFFLDVSAQPGHAGPRRCPHELRPDSCQLLRVGLQGAPDVVLTGYFKINVRLD